MKKLVITLAAALIIATTGCGDSKSPILTYVARANSDGVPHLFTLNESTKQSTQVQISLPSSAAFISVNSDATAATYSRYTGTAWDIFVMGTDSVEKQLTTDANAFASVFSPDGKTIAYVSWQTGTDLIYTMNADGTNQKVLYTPPSGGLDLFYPEFSPDGKSLVFFVEPFLTASAQTRVGTRIPLRHRASSVNGHKAARPAAEPSQDGWYTMSLSGTEPTLVYASSSWWGPAVFSRDGKKLLFTMWDGTASNVFSVNLDGSSLAQLTNSTDPNSPFFSPVPYKNLILLNFINNTTSSWDIYVMNQDGTHQSLIHSTSDTAETLLDSYWGD